MRYTSSHCLRKGRRRNDALAGRHISAYAPRHAYMYACLHVACRVVARAERVDGLTQMFFVLMMHARAYGVVVCRGAALAFESVLISSQSYRHSTRGSALSFLTTHFHASFPPSLSLSPPPPVSLSLPPSLPTQIHAFARSYIHTLMCC
jgi:hypothetical protein